MRSAIALVAVVCTVACVSQGRYKAIEGERDTLVSDKTRLEQQLASLSEQNQEITRELTEREHAVAQLRGTYDNMVAELQSELASGQVEVEQLRNGIRVNVDDEILFPSGSAELDEGGRQLLEKVARQIKDSGHRVEVEGHTDNVPIQTSRYPTNWELAAARASRVVRLLHEQGIEGTRLRAVSNAEFHPVGENETEQGRAKNRRIGIRMIPLTELETAAAPSDDSPPAASADELPKDATKTAAE